MQKERKWQYGILKSKQDILSLIPNYVSHHVGHVFKLLELCG